MYLRRLRFENTGPISKLSFELPFNGEIPKPVLLVGRNGSGKSTLLSFIVNAIISMRQHVFEDIEVTKGKVYRVRSPLAIHGSADFFLAKVEFDHRISMTEWQLSCKKCDHPRHENLSSLDSTWHKIPAQEADHIDFSLTGPGSDTTLEKLLTTHTLLHFPADRFEPPDWLNQENLSPQVALPEIPRHKGRTARQTIARNRLKPTLDWIYSLIYDTVTIEHIDSLATHNGATISVRIPTPGTSHFLLNSVRSILATTLGIQKTDTLLLSVGHRKSRLMGATTFNAGTPIHHIKDLTGLSAGQSALFCMFAAIVRDADLSEASFKDLSDIKGIAIIDEADLHLHPGMQYEILPRLIAMFPKIQFIMTAHSPMVALGLEKVLGADGFQIREMPNGECIDPESYAEFASAMAAFSATKRFQTAVAKDLEKGILPALLVEGKADAKLLETAWKKIYGDKPIPVDIVPVGVEPDPTNRQGGAQMLRQCIEFIPVMSNRRVCAIFDFDRQGFEQFNGLKKSIFKDHIDETSKIHIKERCRATTLPVPPSRKDFVNLNKKIHSFLSIEHFFTDNLLATHGFKMEPILLGSNVFEIDASSDKKLEFARRAEYFDAAEFADFELIFNRLVEIGFIDIAALR